MSATTKEPETKPGTKPSSGALRPRIPTPLWVHWQRSRYQIIPILVVALCSLGAIKLWMGQSSRVHGVGEVNGVQARVISPADGVIITDGRPLALYDNIAAGQVLFKVRKRMTDPADPGVPVTSPIAGKVIAAHRSPGQNVKAGDVVLVIAAEHGRTVTAFIRPDDGLRPEPGMAVDVRLRSAPRKSALARVERIGPQLEPIPAHQLKSSKLRDWGVPAIVALPPGFEARPGELVDLTFRPGETVQEFVNAPASAVDTTVPATPTRGDAKDENH